MPIKNYSIRIDSELLDKLHVISAYAGRSANNQILFLIREAIEAFEEQHGEINFTASVHKSKKQPKKK